MKGGYRNCTNTIFPVLTNQENYIFPLICFSSFFLSPSPFHFDISIVIRQRVNTVELTYFS